MKVKLRKRDSAFPELNLWALEIYSEKGMISADISEQDSKDVEKIITKVNDLLNHKSFATL